MTKIGARARVITTFQRNKLSRFSVASRLLCGCGFAVACIPLLLAILSIIAAVDLSRTWQDEWFLTAPLELILSKSKNQQRTGSNNASHLSRFQPANSKEIRQWGCNRTETPFIFVHVGKSGGGSVGARIAAASLNYTHKSKLDVVDDSYYPLADGDSKARFVSYLFTNHKPSDEKSFEGTVPCHATTPLGHAIACPEILRRFRDTYRRRHGECEHESSDTCNLVYMSHNYLGSEMHWLPTKYLQTWWASLVPQPTTTLPWNKLLSQNTWCTSNNKSRPEDRQEYLRDYEECSIPLQRQVDSMTYRSLSQLLSTDDSNVITSWAPLYASLPVLRVTVLRDPFSWLVSKYFWHRKESDKANGSTCDNIDQAIVLSNSNRVLRQPELQTDKSTPGWVTRMALGYAMNLCGEDCTMRYAAGTATLADIEKQAEANLRRAFSVVGIFEELDTFYDMLSARVQYIDTSLNANVTGKRHSTRRKESIECQARFADPHFQAKLLKRSPELRAINRLYMIAKEVNQFQVKELRQCSLESFSQKPPPRSRESII